MANQAKLNSSKEVITYLAKQFPRCFIAEGEAKPLKIGIFQDLVIRLANEDSISKTQLRSALRLYTTSWRYLYGIKAGAERIDLDGEKCGILEQQHLDHAKKQLKEAKARVQDQKEKQRVNKVEGARKTAKSSAELIIKETVLIPSNDDLNKPSGTDKSTKKIVSSPLSNIPPPTDIKTGQSINLKVGNNLVTATVLEIVKDGARVQLASGLAMIVRKEHLRL